MNILERLIIAHLRHYNHKKYWKMREYVIDPSKKNKLKKYIYLYKIKKSDAFNNCSFGTNLNEGASFEEFPILPHGPNGIIVHHLAIIGRGCTIFHQVTIGESNNKATIIGNNVVIYPGAKIVGNVRIGDNCIIGPNSVVIKNVLDGEIVSGIPAKVIKRQEKQNKIYYNNY